MFEVIKSGLHTTVQDMGREGYQQYGIVVGGAMDVFSLQVGNILVGNHQGEAGLELTLVGPELHILGEGLIAICGADLSPSLDGKPIDLWKSIKVTRGQTLKFGRQKTGVRAYIAVAGGMDVPPVLGSRSTYTKGELGGFQGRPLQKGDVLKRGTTPALKDVVCIAGRGLSRRFRPTYNSHHVLRVIQGPEFDVFTEESIHRLYSAMYIITSDADRMGYRLEGLNLAQRGSGDIISDATSFGTIQVPANGQPIILMADRQTTGGYARIANVISVDHPYLAQMLPGNSISFERIDVVKAQALYRRQQRWFNYLKEEWKGSRHNNKEGYI